MNPRVIVEFNESDTPGLIHAVRRATAARVIGSMYQTMCGETLQSGAERLSYKRGVPTCVRCVIAGVEEVPF